MQKHLTKLATNGLGLLRGIIFKETHSPHHSSPYSRAPLFNSQAGTLLLTPHTSVYHSPGLLAVCLLVFSVCDKD